MCEVDAWMFEVYSRLYDNDLCFRTASSHFDKLHGTLEQCPVTLEELPVT